MRIEGLDIDEARALLGDEYDDFLDEIELVRGASHQFDQDAFLAGKLSPVFFGTALGNFGVREMLDDFVQWAPAPLDRDTTGRRWLREKTSSVALCSRSRPIWIPVTATGSPLCGCAPGSTARA